MPANLLYIYAVLSADSPAVGWLAGAALPGIADRPVHAIVEGPLAAAVGDVPADEFAEEPLNRLMRDMDWLGAHAAAHQAVNAALLARTDALLPLSFGAVYRDTTRLAETLRARRDELLARLEAVRGRSEWVATLHREEAAAVAAAEATDPDLAALRDEIAAASPGRAFLLRSRLEEARRAALVRLDRQAAETVVAGLADLVDCVHTEPIVRATPDAPLARVSLLVRRADESVLAERAAGLAGRWSAHGYRLRLTGPWPPYRFGGAPMESTDAATV